MSGTSVPQTVRSASPASDACRFHSCTRDAPEAAVPDASVRWFQREEQTRVGGPRTRLPDVCNDGVTHFMLQRIFLCTSAFRVVHRERLRAPVEVAQQQARYLPA